MAVGCNRHGGRLGSLTGDLRRGLFEHSDNPLGSGLSIGAIESRTHFGYETIKDESPVALRYARRAQ